MFTRYLKSLFILIGFIIVAIIAALILYTPALAPILNASGGSTLFTIQSVDTMKLSRDSARQMEGDSSFDSVIDDQMKQAASLGATYVAIDTPYDAEFIPVLQRWVAAARAYHLSVWFRGNFSGWESWFSYPKTITREQHTAMVQQFIIQNPSLFQDGDIFTPCPECENGGPGDPRTTGDVAGFRAFLINEYKTSQAAFKQIGKKVTPGYFSMNGDVAELVMDKATTKALGGVVVIDHYVPDVARFDSYISSIAANSGGKIILGEFGAPIPDLNGNMTESQQADFVGQLLHYMYIHRDTVIGMNYWTLSYSSTALLNDDSSPRQVATVLKNYYEAPIATGTVTNDFNEPIMNAVVSVDHTDYKVATSISGVFNIFLPEGAATTTISVDGYNPVSISLTPHQSTGITVKLQPINPGLLHVFERLFYNFRQYISNTF